MFSVIWPAWGEAAGQPRPLRPAIEEFIADMAGRHQYDAPVLRRLLSQAETRPSIIRAMSTPGTARPWHEFRSRNVDDARISGGVRFWQQNAQALARARRDYGVPEELIVATIGIETVYGRNTGSFRVLDALSTLAFDYPPRAEFFRGELEQYLLLTREAGIDPLTVRGSYAGAIGIPQFMPSSYRKYAVDFDGDGKRILWGDAADAIGSVANYYRSFGWREGATVVVPVEVSGSDLDPGLTRDIQPKLKVGDLKRSGIVPLAPVDDAADAALFVLETETGPRYWLGLQNFYVITRYNRSVNYAMAVHELSRDIKAQFAASQAVVQPPR
jgi:membrane-bound lytic murein transglycosylase B